MPLPVTMKLEDDDAHDNKSGYALWNIVVPRRVADPQ